MVEIVVKTNLNLIRRDLEHGRMEPGDVTVDGVPCKTRAEALAAVEQLMASGVTAV